MGETTCDEAADELFQVFLPNSCLSMTMCRQIRQNFGILAPCVPRRIGITGNVIKLLPKSGLALDWHEICTHVNHSDVSHSRFGEDCVLHKCANPVCGANFRDLSRGKLFAVENPFPAAPPIHNRKRPSRHVEHYWLCDRCSSALTLVFEPGRGIATMPLQPKADRDPQYQVSA